MWSSMQCLASQMCMIGKKYLSLCSFSSLLEGCISCFFFSKFWLLCIDLVFIVRRYSDPPLLACCWFQPCCWPPMPSPTLNSTSPNSYAFVSSSSSCVCRFRFKHVKCFLSFIQRSKSITIAQWTAGQHVNIDWKTWTCSNCGKGNSFCETCLVLVN